VQSCYHYFVQRVENWQGMAVASNVGWHLNAVFCQNEMIRVNTQVFESELVASVFLGCVPILE